jgi:hypothetical protein
MNKQVERIKKLRIWLLNQIDGLTTQQLNDIPTGHNNNIIWNLGHLTSVVQTVCYVRAGLPITIDDKFYTPFMTGTKPERFIDEQEIRNIKELSTTSIDTLQENLDLDKNLFQNYIPSVMIPKVYGFDVNNIDEAINYLVYHEGYHAGCVISLKRLV